MIIKKEHNYFRNILGVSTASVVLGVDHTIFTELDHVLRFEVIPGKEENGEDVKWQRLFARP